MIIVTGATGNVGRSLVTALAAAGEKVRTVSREALPADLPAGVAHVQADLGDPQTLRPAFDGGDVLFLLLAGGLLGGGADPGRIFAAARDGGVNRAVLLSSQIVGTRPDLIAYAAMGAAEAALRDAGLAWTILRPSGFASNAYAWAESVRGERIVAAPFADVALPVVDPADVAQAAAVVLRDASHSGQVYELTGPAAITPRQQADALGAALGDEVGFVELTREQAAAHMGQFMPPPIVAGTLDILGAPLPAEQRVSPDLERLLGRPAGTFADWARRSAPAFA